MIGIAQLNRSIDFPLQDARIGHRNQNARGLGPDRLLKGIEFAQRVIARWPDHLGGYLVLSCAALLNPLAAVCQYGSCTFAAIM